MKFPGTRIQWKNGAYRYRPKESERELYGKTWVYVGKSENDVYAFLSKTRVGSSIHTIDEALTKYAAEVMPQKSFKSREGNMISLPRLRKSLGHLAPRALKLPEIIEYRDLIGEHFGKGAANSDLALLSHLFSKLIEWGILENWEHPIRANRIKFPKIPRDRYVTHDEILEAWNAGDLFWRLYIPFKLKTSLDQKTICSIELADVTEEGIYYKRQKLRRYDTNRRPKLRLILWDEELRIIVNGFMARLSEDSTHLVVNRNGEPYIDRNKTAHPLARRWQRLKKIGKFDFTEHDLRAKSLSDEESEQLAAKRADHVGGITKRVYRRKAEAVMPLSLDEIGLGCMIQNLKNDTPTESKDS